MAHPIFKPEPNIEYPLEMLAGPYGDNDTKGPIQGKFGPQWRYLVKVRDVANYWYATPQTNEMLEELRFNVKGAPFTLLKRTKDGKNVGFELAGKTYDDIFPKDAPEEAPQPSQPPLDPDTEAGLTDPLAELEARMITFSRAVNDRLHDLEEENGKRKKQIEAIEKHIAFVPF